MAIDERRRSRLFQQLSSTLGPDEAATMFELLPPPATALATRQDLDQLEERIDARFIGVDARFVSIDQRFDGVDQRFEAVHQRFDGIDQRLDRIENHLRDVNRELHGIRSELTTAVAGQTRALVAGVLTAVVSIAGLSATFNAVF